MSYAKIIVVTLLALGLWVAVVLVGALFGWWRQPVAPKAMRKDSCALPSA